MTYNFTATGLQNLWTIPEVQALLQVQQQPNPLLQHLQQGPLPLFYQSFSSANVLQPPILSSQQLLQPSLQSLNDFFQQQLPHQLLMTQEQLQSAILTQQMLFARNLLSLQNIRTVNQEGFQTAPPLSTQPQQHTVQEVATTSFDVSQLYQSAFQKPQGSMSGGALNTPDLPTPDSESSEPQSTYAQNPMLANNISTQSDGVMSGPLNNASWPNGLFHYNQNFDQSQQSGPIRRGRMMKTDRNNQISGTKIKLTVGSMDLDLDHYSELNRSAGLHVLENSTKTLASLAFKYYQHHSLLHEYMCRLMGMPSRELSQYFKAGDKNELTHLDVTLLNEYWEKMAIWLYCSCRDSIRVPGMEIGGENWCFKPEFKTKNRKPSMKDGDKTLLRKFLDAMVPPVAPQPFGAVEYAITRQFRKMNFYG